MSRIIFVISLCIYLCLPSSNGSLQAQNNDPFSIVGIIGDRFPEVSVLLAEDPQSSLYQQLESGDFELKENNRPVTLISSSYGLENQPLNVAIILDHSEYKSIVDPGKKAASYRLERTKKGIIDFMQTLRIAQDSLMLIGFSSTIDHQTELTDLSYNFDVLESIMAGIEVEGGRALYEAMQEGVEALGPHMGRKVLVVIANGPDQMSETPFETVAGASRIMEIPIYILYLGSDDPGPLSDLARQSGGRVIRVHGSEEVSQNLVELSEELQSVRELRYISPDTSKLRIRSVELDWKGNTENPISHTYRHIQGRRLLNLEKTIESESANTSAVGNGVKDYPLWQRVAGMALAVVLCLGLVIGFIRWRQGKANANQIVPAVIFVDTVVRKGKILIRFNVPIKSKPARITLTTQQGRPVKDYIYSGRRSKAKLDVSDLSDGIYMCSLTNASMVSDAVELIVTT